MSLSISSDEDVVLSAGMSVLRFFCATRSVARESNSLEVEGLMLFFFFAIGGQTTVKNDDKLPADSELRFTVEIWQVTGHQCMHILNSIA